MLSCEKERETVCKVYKQQLLAIQIPPLLQLDELRAWHDRTK